jgi:hypothetical protein
MITRPVQLALTAMTGDLARPWSVADLARAASVSPSRLHRLFRTEVGSTPLGWLTRSRAERFAVLLLGSDDTIAVLGPELRQPPVPPGLRDLPLRLPPPPRLRPDRHLARHDHEASLQ